MGELTQPELYPTRSSSELWQSLWNWLAFFFQIFLRILRGFSHHSLLSRRSFKPLPLVELPEQEHAPPETAASAAVDSSSSSSVVDLSPGVDRIERLTVVLDLDETLVCAYETSSLPASIRDHAIESGLKWFEMDYISSEKAREGVTVFERPGLQEFLKQLSEFADLVLFTAGLEGYARPLVDRIDVENLFCLRLYRPSTIKSEHREHVKDLSCLSRDLCRTVIVDNNPFSFLLQPTNGIPCIPFSAGQPNDDQLLTVLLPLLKHLSQQRDVRPVLYEKFHMPEWFQRHGISALALA